MMVVDLNLLIYAVNADSPPHDAARRWWEAVLSADEPVGLPWVVIQGFLRVTTHPRVMPRPLTAAQATGLIDAWLGRPPVTVLTETPRHWSILKELLEAAGTAGNLTTDAHLAAIAIEHGAVLWSADNDFGRFRGLRWRNPLA